MRHLWKVAYLWRQPRFAVRGAWCLVVAIALVGCSKTSAVRMAGTAGNLARESAGLTLSSGKFSLVIPVRITTDKSLNTIKGGQSLSLVVRIYQLRSAQSFEVMTYKQANASDAGKAALGDDLVSMSEVTLLPGKSYELPQTAPGEVTAIGVIGLFHAPAVNRWRLSFDARASSSAGIRIGVHACSLTKAEGTLTSSFATQSASIAAKTQCNG